MYFSSEGPPLRYSVQGQIARTGRILIRPLSPDDIQCGFEEQLVCLGIKMEAYTKLVAKVPDLLNRWTHTIME